VAPHRRAAGGADEGLTAPFGHRSQESTWNSKVTP